MRTLTPQAFNELVLKLLGFLLMGITPVTKGTMVLKPEEVVVLGTLDALEQLLDVKVRRHLPPSTPGKARDTHR